MRRSYPRLGAQDSRKFGAWTAKAETSGPQWGISYNFDGYGNKLGQSVTKGSAPSHSFTMQTAQNPHASNQSQITNRISGQTYNASGELLAVNGVGLDYDGYGRNVRVTTGSNQDKWWHSGAGADRVLVEKGSNGPVKISFYAGR